MKQTDRDYFAKKTEALVEEYLRRDIVSAETRQRAEGLHSRGDTAEALEVLVENCRQRQCEEATQNWKLAD